MREYHAEKITIGVVGLGLMGSSIVVSLLASGHQVCALGPLPGENEQAAGHIADLMRQAERSGFLSPGIERALSLLRLVRNYEDLHHCAVVLECVTEDKAIKGSVYNKIAAAVSEQAVIASNTSAIPISELQELVPRPERFLGVHWAEPAYATRFLEITCGRQTAPETADYLMELGERWGKEPTLLRKDIRGFITNRLMYAVYREALTLIEAGHMTISDADKAFRYDVGSWITLMGIFRRLDLMGLKDYVYSYRLLLDQLNNTHEVPAIMQRIVERKGRGIHNQSGLYTYSDQDVKDWEEAFAQFNADIYRLAARYAEEELIPQIR
jgi:3-hydroxybutyryl-CoA dehydrogenase